MITDQQRRCPVCLRLLTNPVRIGTPSRTFLEWYGAESTCSRGHGLLHGFGDFRAVIPRKRSGSAWAIPGAVFFRHGIHDAGTAQRLESIQQHPGRGQRKFSGARRRDHRIPGTERVRQVHHHENDHGAAADDVGQDSIRRRTHRTRPDRVQAADGLRARRAASLRAPERPGVSDDGGPTAQSSSRKAYGRPH